VDRPTIAAYESRATEWARLRPATRRDLAHELTARTPPGLWRADLGCGTGAYTADLGEPVVALDASFAMANLVAEPAPRAARVVADLEALPFRRGVLGAGWARAAYLHVPPDHLPLALADLHRALVVGAPLYATLTRGDGWAVRADDDEFPGRSFSGWETDPLRAVLTGAGFDVERIDADDEWLTVRARRARTLPDFVAPGMRLLLVGLNPSLYAADAGVGFARPGNRFWPAALDAGIVTRDRDPWHALRHHGVGMSDCVKRATVGAAELTREEYVDGIARLDALVRWLAPRTVCFVGLDGYRKAVDRKARPGEQPDGFAGARCYVMPNPSGLNAHTNVAELSAHLRAAYDLD
jgi:TDG/mug DNA glycosylase family protein